jgi:hypothetical protein
MSMGYACAESGLQAIDPKGRLRAFPDATLHSIWKALPASLARSAALRQESLQKRLRRPAFLSKAVPHDSHLSCGSRRLVLFDWCWEYSTSAAAPWQAPFAFSGGVGCIGCLPLIGQSTNGCPQLRLQPSANEGTDLDWGRIPALGNSSVQRASVDGAALAANLATGFVGVYEIIRINII